MVILQEIHVNSTSEITLGVPLEFLKEILGKFLQAFIGNSFKKSLKSSSGKHPGVPWEFLLGFLGNFLKS